MDVLCCSFVSMSRVYKLILRVPVLLCVLELKQENVAMCVNVLCGHVTDIFKWVGALLHCSGNMWK